MKVGDVMTPVVDVVAPSDNLRTAARLMAQLDLTALPVGEGDKLVGIITSRDIAIRIVAEGRDPDTTTVSQTMSTDVLYCFEEEPIEEVSKKMGDWWVRRLPVVSPDKRLLGIVSLGELALAEPLQRDFGRELAA